MTCLGPVDVLNLVISSSQSGSKLSQSIPTPHNGYVNAEPLFKGRAGRAAF